MMVAEVTVELEGSTAYPALYKVMMDKLNEQRQLDQFTDITLIVDGTQDTLSWCLGEIPVCSIFVLILSFINNRTPVQSP